MPNAQQVQSYFDILARALRVVENFPGNKQEIFALENSEKIFLDTRSFLLSAFKLGEEEFLREIELFVSTIEKDNNPDKFIKATTMCQFLDEKISYLDSCEDSFSVFSLISVYSNNVVVLDKPLNNNYKEICICINPKLPVSFLYTEDEQQDYPQRLFNRDGYMGINGDLNNISYIKWNESLSVINIIIPKDFSKEKPARFKIAFSPLSNRKDLLHTDTTEFKRGETSFTGEFLKELNYSTELDNSFRDAWSVACQANADVFFAPEMLCTGNMFTTENDYNCLIRHMSLEKLSLGESPPNITITPSFWRENSNSCQIIYQDGKVLGEQFKFNPFVNKKKRCMEALKIIDKKEIILLHIPGIHRIVVMLCSDFLTNQESWLENIICKQLLPSLILVPSFSPGEQDFINSLSTVKRYGASVIWGNCCGAKINGENQIGGCGVVGCDSIMRLKEVNECGLSCDGTQSCLFTIDLPLKLTGNKEKDKIYLTHLLNSDKI